MDQKRFTRMDQKNWDVIRDIAMKDPTRMAAYNAWAKLHERMGEADYVHTFGDLRRWDELHQRLLQREWRILEEYNAAHAST